MCTVAAGLLTASLVGTMIRAVGQYQQGRNESAESEFRATVASNNATIANQNAVAAIDKGQAEASDKRLETSQKKSLQRAQLAAAGFDISSGSSIDILADTAALGEFDVLRIEADASDRADNFRQQASDFKAEASLGRFASKNQKKSGKFRVGATLITGATRAGTSFLNRKP